MKKLSKDTMSVSEIMVAEPKKIKLYTYLTIDIQRAMIVLELTYGVVLETYFTDEEGITTVETLFRSLKKRDFTILGRWRYGENHSEFRSYPRDNQYPLHSIVRL